MGPMILYLLRLRHEQLSKVVPLLVAQFVFSFQVSYYDGNCTPFDCVGAILPNLIQTLRFI